jgi:hypothetical protein
MASVLQHADTRKLKSDIDWLLANVHDDAELLQRLEGTASHPKFGALTWHWAPRLYRRGKARFRPFVLQHFADLAQWQDKRWHSEALRWEGEVGRELEPWFDEVDRANDVALFRKLYAWKHRSRMGWSIDAEAWRRDLLARFKAAATPAARAMVLDKFDLWQSLDEPAAQALYAHDPALAAGFILKKLPSPYLFKTAPFWTVLMQQAQARGDDDFRCKIYRRQAPLATWERDALALCRQLSDPAELNAALERIHPQDRWQDLGEGLARIMQARELDVLPYVRAHLRQVFSYWGRKGYDQLEQLARSRGWVDFRIALVLTCGQGKAYNLAVAETLDDRELAEPERLRRLALFSGVSREWNGAGWGLARVQQLDPPLALRLYGRYPELVRTLFKAQVTPAWRDTYEELFDRAWADGDTELVDHLASRYVTRGAWRDSQETGLVDRVADLLAGLKLSETDFARRASGILTRIPAYAIHNYNELVRNNRLARLLFERSLSGFLADAPSVRDLVEGSEIHVQRLAYRVLSLPDARARALARDNLDILIGTLLRPLHRETRMQALRALDNAARHADAAEQVLATARDAFVLPDEHYPKEALVGLVGRLLARHPHLAGPGETPVVYRRTATAAEAGS